MSDNFDVSVLTPEKMRSPNMVSPFKHSPFKINFLLSGSGMDLEPKANITVLCVFSLSPFRVRLHVTKTESHPGMKKFLFTCQFHPGRKRVEFHPGMNLNLNKNFPFSMKRYKKNYYFAWYVKTSVHHFRLLIFLLRHFGSSRLEVLCKTGWPATLLKKRLWHRCEFCKISKNTPFLQNISGGHLQTWCYDIEQNRNYGTNLTTIKCGLNENNTDQWYV